MGLAIGFAPRAIDAYTRMVDGDPPPAAERKRRLASIAGMAIALGANPRNAKRVAAQIFELFGGKVFSASLFNKERSELPPQVNQEIEQLGRLLLAGAPQRMAYPVGAWAVALAHEDLKGPHYQSVGGWVGRMAGSSAASQAFDAYVRDHG